MAGAAGYAAGRFVRQGGAPQYQRRQPTQSLEGIAPADGDELVAGRRPVEEAFVARRDARRLLVVPQRRMALEKLVLHATSLRIPVVEVEGGSLTAIAGFDGHQGIALVVAPRRWAAPDDILALAKQRDQAPLILVLDSLEDPQNVGTLLRTAEATGVHGAVFPTHHQAPLSPAAIKASAGAVEHLQLAPVDDLAGALADLHARGLRIVGADGDAPLTAREADLRGPVVIVVGSEGRGLSLAVRRRCDLLVRIPMHGRIESLNAAVAGSILLYEAAAQRGSHGERPAPSSVVLGTASDEDTADEPASVAPGEDAPPTEAAAPSEPADVPEPEQAPTPPAAKHAAKSKAEKPAKPSKPEKAEKAEKADKPDRAAKAAKPAKTAKATAEPTVTETAEPKARAKGKAKAAAASATTEDAPSAPKRTRSTKRAASSAPPPDAMSDDDDLLPGGPAIDASDRSAEPSDRAPEPPAEV